MLFVVASFLLLIQAVLAQNVSLTNTSVYVFGTDFSAVVFRRAVFDYGLQIKNNAEIIYTAVPLAAIKCGYEGNTDVACASMFHLFNAGSLKLDFDNGFGGRHLQDTAAATLEIDLAVSPSTVDTNLPDIQHYPAFVYGVTPVFNLPGISKLVLSKEALARIFRGCGHSSASTAAPTVQPSNSPSVSPTNAPSTSPTDTNTFSQSPTESEPTPSPQTAPTAAPTHVNPDNLCLPNSITRWDDPAILETNDESIHALLSTFGEIKVFVSADAGPITRAFKTALSRFEDAFAQQIGNEDDNVWAGTTFPQYSGTFGVLSKVSQTPGSITFDAIHLVIQQSGVTAAHLQVGNGRIVAPVTKSLYAAFFEVGLEFGNDGSDPSLQTIDLTMASGIQSWPISLLAYISTRTTHTPLNCYQRKQGILSFLGFYYSQGTGDMSVNTGTAYLSDEASVKVLSLLREQLKCDGSQVYVQPVAPPSVQIMSDATLHTLLTTFLSDSTATGTYTARVLPTPTHVEMRDAWNCLANRTSCYIKSDLVVLADENLSAYLLEDEKTSNYNLFSMPYVAVATGFIYNFCMSSSAECQYRYRTPLVLDVITAAHILDGNIRFWNDTAIAALNPDKLLPNEPIQVIAGPKYENFFFQFVQKVRNTYLPTFGYRMDALSQRNRYYEAWKDVSLNQFSFSFVVLNSTAVEGVERIALRNDQGIDVVATPESIEACAFDTFDGTMRMFHLSHSSEPDCYPLTTTFNLYVKNPLVNAPPARLLQTLVQQATRTTAKGRTAAYSNNLGTLIDLKVEQADLAVVNFDYLERLMSDITGKSILRVPHELNLIPQDLISTLYAVMGIEMAVFLALALWTLANRNRKLIRNSSPVFMIQVLFGAAVMVATVIPLSMQDEDLIPRAMSQEQLMDKRRDLDLACVVSPILFSVGYFVTFSAIFLKTWRLIRIFNNVKLKNLFLKDRDLLMYQVVVIVVVVVLNVLWAGIDPMVWRRFSLYENGDGMVIGSAGICHSESGIGPAMPLMVGIILLLVVGNYLAYLGRRIPTEFNESKWTAMSMMMILESFIIAVPVLVLSNDQPVPGFIIKSLVCLLVAGGTVGLIFVPKIMLAYGIGENKDDSNPWRFVRASDSSNNTNNSKKVAVQQEAMLSQIVNATVTATNLDMRPLSSGGGPSARSVPMSTIHSVKSYPSASASTSQALARVLQDDPTRRKFRRFLKTLKMEENVRFWDATMITKAETNENKRYVGTRAVIQSFVIDNAPFQVNLSSATKDEIVAAYDADDKQKLRDPAFFDHAMAEMFDDLRQSDAFRAFLENDTFSTQNLA